MGLVGLSALRSTGGAAPQGIELRAHVPTLDRDLVFFLVFFAARPGARASAPDGLRIPAGIVFVAAYPVYVWLTLAAGARPRPEETLNPLIMDRTRPDGDRPGAADRALQLLVGLGAMVGGAHLFVEELLKVAEDLGVEAIVLSLILAPLATELPEKVEQLLLGARRQGRLALGNITGAMVFQSTIPVAIGLRLHRVGPERQRRRLRRPRAGRRRARLLGTAPARPLRAPAVLAWIALYAAFIVVVAV